jgi:hypothetical protein
MEIRDGVMHMTSTELSAAATRRRAEAAVGPLLLSRCIMISLGEPRSALEVAKDYGLLIINEEQRLAGQDAYEG